MNNNEFFEQFCNTFQQLISNIYAEIGEENENQHENLLYQLSILSDKILENEKRYQSYINNLSRESRDLLSDIETLIEAYRKIEEEKNNSLEKNRQLAKNNEEL